MIISKTMTIKPQIIRIKNKTLEVPIPISVFIIESEVEENSSQDKGEKQCVSERVYL